MFARKLLRPSHNTTQEDIDNEMRAIEILCERDTHENIVKVLEHGWLTNSPYYFIDMELCDYNLETYIYSDRLPWLNEIYPSDPQSVNDIGLYNMWGIVEQIVLGLEFIHSHRLVHRDLKPRNGNDVKKTADV